MGNFFFTNSEVDNIGWQKFGSGKFDSRLIKYLDKKFISGVYSNYKLDTELDLDLESNVRCLNPTVRMFEFMIWFADILT